MKHIKDFNEAFFDFFKGKPKEEVVDKSISRRRKPTPEEEISNREQAERHKEEKERANLAREEGLNKERERLRALADKHAENQRRHDEWLRQNRQNRDELKTELDPIFINFIDRGVVTACSITKRNKSSVYYDYKFEVKYPVTKETNIISKTFKKISEDILDIEAYMEYIKSKYPYLKSTIDFEKGDRNFKLNILIRTTI
jgi:hypothetical protein